MSDSRFITEYFGGRPPHWPQPLPVRCANCHQYGHNPVDCPESVTALKARIKLLEERLAKHEPLEAKPE